MTGSVFSATCDGSGPGLSPGLCGGDIICRVFGRCRSHAEMPNGDSASRSLQRCVCLAATALSAANEIYNAPICNMYYSNVKDANRRTAVASHCARGWNRIRYESRVVFIEQRYAALTLEMPEKNI